MNNISITLICFLTAIVSGCASPHKQFLRIESTPPDALVSISSTEKPSTEMRKVAGSTPMEKELTFPEANSVWLLFEKRGYASQTIRVTPETNKVSAQLERVKDKEGKDAKEFSFPIVRRILMVRPDVPVIQRGFSAEQVSDEETNNAQAGLVKGAREFLSGNYDVLTPAFTADDERLLRSLWRDGRTAMEVVDPVRLKYLPVNPGLETKSGREAVYQLGKRYGAEAILLITGKQNFETAGMKIGKVGLTTAGTAASYGSGYANATARGDSFFVYTIYTPHFAEGTFLKTIMIDCANGEILWANRGLWGPLRLDDPDTAKAIAADLFAGL